MTSLSHKFNRIFVRNLIYNLAGQGLPIVVAIFSIPMLINGIGTERFGVLTLIWVVLGYASIFDLGIGRALTKIVAEYIGEEREEDIPPLIWTALLLMIVLGVVGTILLIATSNYLVLDLLKVPKVLGLDTVNSFYIVALSIPCLLYTSRCV